MTTRRLVIDTNDQGQFFLLVEGDSVTIGGSRKHADTVLKNVRVCRVHCELEVEGDHVAVTGDPARPGPAELRVGEFLRAGNADLRLEADSEARSSEKIPVVPVGGTAPTSAPATPTAPSPPALAQLLKRLVVVDGADQGQSFSLPESGTIRIGKDRRHAEIILNDLYVARTHCRLDVEGEQVTVCHEAGATGTLINGHKIIQKEIHVGDVLRVGNSHLRLEVYLPGEEFAKVAGQEPEPPIEAPVEKPREVGTIAFARDRADATEPAGEEVEIEVVEDGDDEALPADASQPVRLLHEWRQRLTQLTGQTFGRYRLGELLGRGRCGVVFRADDLKSSQKVALKVLSPQFPHNDQELQRFTRVIREILPLRHPNLVTLHGAGKTGAYTWIAREYVEGESVASVIRRLGTTTPQEWRRAWRVALHVGRALDFARQHHLRHGKITPRNILLARGDRAARLGDLMLANVLEGSQLLKAAQAHQPMADLVCLAPEQAQPGAFVDEMSDMYSLGAVVYALLTGRPPFMGDSAEEILEQIRGTTKVAKPRAFNDSIPPPLEKVVLKMLAKHQEDRYQTPADLLKDLEPIAKEHGVEV